MVARNPKANRGPGAVERNQPLCDPRISAPAARKLRPRSNSGFFWTMVQSKRDVGRTGWTLDRLPRPIELPPAAGAVRGRPGLFLWRRLKPDGNFRQQGPRNSDRTWIRLC